MSTLRHRLTPRVLRAVLAFAPAAAVPLAGCGSSVTEPSLATVESTTFAPSLGIDLTAAGWTRSSTGLYIRTLTAASGTGAGTTAGQQDSVRYTGWLSNGSQFDAGTISFTLGAGQVIPGWDQGIAGMRVGERRRLLIPPALAYGASGRGPIPGNSVLVFDVELLNAR